MTRWQTVLPVSPLPDRIAGWHLSRRVTESKRRVFIISCQMYLVHNYLIALVYGQKESVHSPLTQMDCKQVSRRVLPAHPLSGYSCGNRCLATCNQNSCTVIYPKK